MWKEDFEHSDYERLMIVGDHSVDIEIFREVGSFEWTLTVSIDDGEDGKDWLHPFLADKAAYDAAVIYLREKKLFADMYAIDEDEIAIEYSRKSQSIMVEGHRFEIQIYKAIDENSWILEVENEKGTSFIPDERFTTGEDAFGAAIADFENTPIEDFLV